ncbi:MAG TPA: universal stress protein [Polyangiaceae bacterium]|nr:universal stress protein [Polyangiaceae bacterium]
MFRRILVGFDGSEGATLALGRAAELAEAGQGELHLVGVGRLPDYAETEGEIDEAREQAETFYAKKLADAAAAMQQRGITANTHLAFGKPSDQILRVADEVHADLIVLGVHPHHPMRRRLLGATADKVVDFADCSVIVVR